MCCFCNKNEPRASLAIALPPVPLSLFWALSVLNCCRMKVGEQELLPTMAIRACIVANITSLVLSREVLKAVDQRAVPENERCCQFQVAGALVSVARGGGGHRGDGGGGCKRSRCHSEGAAPLALPHGDDTQIDVLTTDRSSFVPHGAMRSDTRLTRWCGLNAR